MENDAQETRFTLIFGIAGILIAFTALAVAYLQLRRMRRVHAIYELASMSSALRYVPLLWISTGD